MQSNMLARVTLLWGLVLAVGNANAVVTLHLTEASYGRTTVALSGSTDGTGGCCTVWSAVINGNFITTGHVGSVEPISASTPALNGVPVWQFELFDIGDVDEVHMTLVDFVEHPLTVSGSGSATLDWLGYSYLIPGTYDALSGDFGTAFRVVVGAAPAPAPGVLALLSAGLAAIGFTRRKRLS